MKTLLTLTLLLISIISSAQCGYPIDTTITPTYYNANALNSSQIQDSSLCIDSIYPSTGVIWLKIIADSQSAIVDWSDIPDSNCTSGIFYVWEVFDCVGTQIMHTTTPWVWPHSGWVGSGAKHFDSLVIGDTYYFKMTYAKYGNKCERFEVCMWYYSVGTDFLDLHGVLEEGVFSDAYPNPVNNIVLFDTPEEYFNIMVYSMSGRPMGIFNKLGGETRFDLEVTDMPSGEYFITFYSNNNNKKYVRRFTVMH